MNVRCRFLTSVHGYSTGEEAMFSPERAAGLVRLHYVEVVEGIPVASGPEPDPDLSKEQERLDEDLEDEDGPRRSPKDRMLRRRTTK